MLCSPQEPNGGFKKEAPYKRGSAECRKTYKEVIDDRKKEIRDKAWDALVEVMNLNIMEYFQRA